ncbi:MAG TPA: c-type cytochrome, partial [Candidatus Binatia bacterium]
MHRIIALASVLIAVLACSKEKKEKEVSHQDMATHGMSADWKFTLPKGDPSEGRKVFVEVECFKCHEVKGEKFPDVAEGEKGVGPELSQMAGMHPVEFFAESIINPNAVIDPKGKELGYLGNDGKSKMPDYNSVLTVKQVVDLAAYLASLKGSEHKT